jgi:hypothetical protein
LEDKKSSFSDSSRDIDVTPLGLLIAKSPERGRLKSVEEDGAASSGLVVFNADSSIVQEEWFVRKVVGILRPRRVEVLPGSELAANRRVSIIPCRRRCREQPTTNRMAIGIAHAYAKVQQHNTFWDTTQLLVLLHQKPRAFQPIHSMNHVFTKACVKKPEANQ